MSTSQATGGTVCARQSTANVALTETKVMVAFPSTYTINTTEANWSVTTTNLPAGTFAWPGISAPTGASDADNTAKTVLFVSGDLADDTKTYCFNFSGTNTLTTAASTANNEQAYVKTVMAGPADVDLTNIALTTVTNDQITITAVVPPTFVFTLNGNTDSFTGNLDPATIKSTGGRTVTVTTNAPGGFIVWAKGDFAGLHSATAGVGGPETLSVGNEGYYLDVDASIVAGGCLNTPDIEYDGAGTTQGGAIFTTFKAIDACTGTAPATANLEVITLVERVEISGATPAGTDYSSTISVVGAGNF
jgi:hypothetical protein